MCFQLGRLPALDGQSPETGDDVCRGALVCLQSPSTECAAPEACNAHYHATLVQHSLPLRPRQQAPGHADLRQWQCRVSIQRETATSDDNSSNLRCWRNAGGDSGVTLQPKAGLDCQVRNANKQTAFRCCATPTRPLCELQMDAPSPELCFMNELGDVRGLKCSRAFSAFCIFERAI